MITFVENDKVKISFLPGKSNLCVVAFTGVGLALGGIGLGDIQQEEFKKSLQDELCNVIFVIDKLRSWYSDPDVVCHALTSVNELRRKWNLDRIVTIGNSMGGSGAVYFGGLMGADLSLSFAAQSSVSRDVAPFERRYDSYLDRLPKGLRRLDFAKAALPREAILFYGLNCPEDNLHARRFFDAGLAPVIVRNADHNVAAALKRDGHLKAILTAAMHGGQARVMAYVESAVAILDAEQARRLMVSNTIFSRARNAGSAGEAIALMRRAISLFDSCPYYHAELGRALLAAGDLSGAGRALERANALLRQEPATDQQPGPDGPPTSSPEDQLGMQAGFPAFCGMPGPR